MRGRKGLTEETGKRICEFLRSCPNITLAFESVGLDRDCYYDWRAKAASSQDPENEYVRFARDADAAIAQWLAGKVRSIEMAGESDPRNWTAHAWLCERLRPDIFARKERLEHSGPDGGPIATVDVRSLSDEQLERLRAGESLSLVLGSGSRGGVPEAAEE